MSDNIKIASNFEEIQVLSNEFYDEGKRNVVIHLFQNPSGKIKAFVRTVQKNFSLSGIGPEKEHIISIFIRGAKPISKSKEETFSNTMKIKGEIKNYLDAQDYVGFQTYLESFSSEPIPKKLLDHIKDIDDFDLSDNDITNEQFIAIKNEEKQQKSILEHFYEEDTVVPIINNRDENKKDSPMTIDEESNTKNIENSILNGKNDKFPTKN